MYKSPIEIVYGQMKTQMEGDIYRAVQSYGINVDKAELLRALQYDRDQYEKGYADAKADAMAELVRCKDCLWFDQKDKLADVFRQERHCYCTEMNTYMPESGFCSSGERKGGN